MTDGAGDDRTVFLSELPAGRGEYRFAAAVVGASTLIFLILVPFAKVRLAPLPTFIAVYQSALLINDLITAVFLLCQSQFSQTKALSWLAGGYLFTALIATSHAFTFPGLFSPTGLLGAGPQTTAWLYLFWHSGFPLFVIGYASHAAEQQPTPQGVGAILAKVASVLAAVCAFALIATLGHRFLPPVIEDDHYLPLAAIAVSGVWILNLAALLVLLRRRPYSVLDLWLIVTMGAWLFDIALSALLNSGRYDLGFYAGRIYGLIAASLVLVVLLTGNSKLYLQLAKLRESERQKVAELLQLSMIDALTGIANRRAFEEALGQEWRRMLRHGTVLSLLMIDVDYFKRFNDTYGHVAGDHCLRAVAQALAGRARRAGEMVARYGGEEFAVLLPHCSIDDARRLGELICVSVREQNIPHAGSAIAPHLTISVGAASVAEVPPSAAALSRDSTAPISPPGAGVLIETADQALYQAKMSGRNRVVTAGDDVTTPVAV